MPGLAGITSAVLQRRSRHSARRCFITCLLLLASSFSASAQYGWTGTWASAPLAGKPNPTLVGKTLRQIIHTSVSGSRIRVRISNVFGDQPLRIEDVHIAIPSTGGSIVPVTDRQLRFQHRSFEVIPPGASALSDALRFEFPALSDVAISLYLPSVPGTITWHPSAHRISYMARGDRSGAADLPNAERTGSCYFLTGVDVQGTGLRGSVVTLGASITEGYKATDGMNREWPAVLAQRLTVAHIGLGVLNEGISGNRLLHPGAGPDAGSRFQSDVLDQTGVRWVIFSDDPINDLGSTQPPPTLNQLISATEELIAAALVATSAFTARRLRRLRAPITGQPRKKPSASSSTALFVAPPAAVMPLLIRIAPRTTPTTRPASCPLTIAATTSTPTTPVIAPSPMPSTSRCFAKTFPLILPGIFAETGPTEPVRTEPVRMH